MKTSLSVFISALVCLSGSVPSMALDRHLKVTTAQDVFYLRVKNLRLKGLDIKAPVSLQKPINTFLKKHKTGTLQNLSTKYPLRLTPYPTTYVKRYKGWFPPSKSKHITHLCLPPVPGIGASFKALQDERFYLKRLRKLEKLGIEASILQTLIQGSKNTQKKEDILWQTTIKSFRLLKTFSLENLPSGKCSTYLGKIFQSGYLDHLKAFYLSFKTWEINNPTVNELFTFTPDLVSGLKYLPEGLNTLGLSASSLSCPVKEVYDFLKQRFATHPEKSLYLYLGLKPGFYIDENAESLMTTFPVLPLKTLTLPSFDRWPKSFTPLSTEFNKNLHTLRVRLYENSEAFLPLLSYLQELSFPRLTTVHIACPEIFFKGKTYENKTALYDILSKVYWKACQNIYYHGLTTFIEGLLGNPHFSLHTLSLDLSDPYQVGKPLREEVNIDNIIPLMVKQNALRTLTLTAPTFNEKQISKLVDKLKNLKFLANFTLKASINAGEPLTIARLFNQAPWPLEKLELYFQLNDDEWADIDTQYDSAEQFALNLTQDAPWKDSIRSLSIPLDGFRESRTAILNVDWQKKLPKPQFPRLRLKFNSGGFEKIVLDNTRGSLVPKKL